jgi:DNA-directed RNA polymerase specialized sigma24 family protein
MDDRRSALDLVGKVLSRIDPPLVEVFVLFEIAEYSAIEIARQLGIPMGTCRLAPAARARSLPRPSPIA